MRKVAMALTLLTLLSLTVGAQRVEVRRGNCTSLPTSGADMARAQQQRRLATPSSDWDSTRVYRQLVILFSFNDKDFSYENPRETYDKIFNQTGYNERKGPGCVAEYFREQSGGRLNLQFDVYGPYKIDSPAQPYTNPDEDTKNKGKTQMKAATTMFLEDHPEIDFSVYDWNGNGTVNQVIYVFAGYAGNESSSKSYGHIWPNTSNFSIIWTPDHKRITNYTSSGELWTNNKPCGIGTICHEFTHSLGLPDIYPTNGWTYTAVDEWDLMDGGNFTNYGWCPPNYSPLEKMLLGWLEPVELTGPTSVTDMKPVSEGGEVYLVKHTDKEYYLLENRQWRGWDFGAPGRGLVVYHVDYDQGSWTSNSLNNRNNMFRYQIVAADNRTYDDWDTVTRDVMHVTSKNQTYRNDDRMNSYYLSGSAYPYTPDAGETIMALTDETVPAATMYNANGEGSKLLSKPITNIRMTEDGLISFDFMGGTTGVERVTSHRPCQAEECIDLMGRKLPAGSHARLYIIKGTDGKVRKVIR